MDKRAPATFVLCAASLLSCSVKPVTFEEAPRCEQGPCLEYGTGADGDVSVSDEKDLNADSLGATSDANGAYADGIAFKVVQAPSGQTLVVAGDPTGAFVAGDQLLLIELQGADGDAGSAGAYEVLEVASTSDRQINVVRAIGGSYAGSNFENHKVVVQRIPQFDSVAVLDGGRITASKWDGLAAAENGAAVATGIVAMFVKGTLAISGSGLDVSVKGFRGGVAGGRGPEDATSPNLAAGGQDGAPGAFSTAGGRGGGVSGGGSGGTAAFAGGAAGRGGGGGGSSADDNGCGAGGSGAGGAAPHDSGANPSSLAESTLALGGGAAAGGGGGAGGVVANLTPTFASGGGSRSGRGGTIGQPFSIGGSGSAGEAGGGIIFVHAGTLTGAGPISSNGGVGGSGGGGGGGAGYDGAAGGGGGAGANGAAGGSILVRYGASSWSGSLSALGGHGGGGGGGGGGDGGGAGGGGGGGSGGGGGGGGTRTNCEVPRVNASNGGAGGSAGNCGAVVSTGDASVGGGGAASGGGGSTSRGNCASAAANTGGISAAGNGASGNPNIDGGSGGAGGTARMPIWSGGGGGGQAGDVGAAGFTSVDAL